MVVICPTVTEYDPHSYRQRMEQLAKFAKRVHVDLMDGVFAPTKSPDLEKIWWPAELEADLHLMYQKPMESVDQLVKLRPRLVVIHLEAEVDHKDFAAKLHAAGIKAGLAVLQHTSLESAADILLEYDHAMVFSGDLGKHQGTADLSLLAKVRNLRAQYPDIEISWDGGINDTNATQLIEAGVTVLNVGGFIAGAEDPQAAYAKLETVIGTV